MNEIEIIKKVIHSWNLSPETTQGWQKLAEFLQNAYGTAGLVLWAHDALAQTGSTIGEKEKLVVAAYLCAVFLAQNQGHTLLDTDSPLLHELLRRIRDASNDDFFLPEVAVRVFERCAGGPLANLFASNGNPLTAPFVLGKTTIQLSRTRWMEDACIRMLRARMQAPPMNAECDVMAGYPGKLDEQQREMIRRAVVHRVFWVSGGPGTGKTTCIHGLLHALGRLGVPPGRVVLAAPTGKAAFRVTSSLRSMAEEGSEPFDKAILDGSLEAKTLHRLLEYQPAADRFGRHEGHPLDIDCVIVDESSMVDLAMLHALLRALPADSAVVFVGDQNQLPAVGQGAPFQTAWEFSSFRPDFFYRLERNYRAQLALFQDLERLLTNDESLPWNTYEFLSGNNNGLFLHQLNSDLEFLKFLENVFHENYNDFYWKLALAPHQLTEMVVPAQDPQNARLLQLVELAQACPVLCAVHGGMRGTQRVNDFMRRRHPRGSADLQPGEPVMVQANDYARSLFNGDFGVVADIGIHNRMLRCAVFKTGDRLRAFELVNLQVERAYAFSVHKSQGSEYDRVTFVLPEAASGILTRELVYTALTRARHAVRVAGDKFTMLMALQSVVRRRSRLAQAWMEPSSE